MKLFQLNVHKINKPEIYMYPMHAHLSIYTNTHNNTHTTKIPFNMSEKTQEEVQI